MVGRKDLTSCACGPQASSVMLLGKLRVGCEMGERRVETRRAAEPSLQTLHA